MMKNSDMDTTTLKKKKKSSVLTIYDVLKNPDEVNVHKAPVLAQHKGFHSNAARWNEALAPKTFVMKKKKKKKLSTFKKKILLERLKVHISAKIAASSLLTADAGSIEEPTADACSSKTIRIFNFIEDIDLSDEYEVRETVRELRGLLLPIGAVEEIRIMVAASDGEEVSAFTTVTFSTAACASSAVGVISGLVCGGSTLIAALDDGLPLCESNQTQSGTAESSVVPAIQSAVLHPNSPVALYLHNLVSSDTLDDADEVQEVLGDVKELCQVFGAIHSVWIERRETAQHQSNCKSSYGSTAAASLLPWGVIVFSDVRDAISAAKCLNSRVIAGSSLQASVMDLGAYEQQVHSDDYLIEISDTCEFAVRLRGFATEEEVGTDEERAEVVENVLSIFSEAGQQISSENVIMFAEGNDSNGDQNMVSIEVVLPSLQACCEARKAIASVVLGGQAIVADIVERAPVARTTAVQRRTLCGSSGAAVVVVRNYFGEDDLQEGDEDLAVLKRDLLDLSACGGEGGTSKAAASSDTDTGSRGIVQRVYVYRGQGGTAQEQSEDPAGPAGSAGAEVYVMGVAYFEASAAQEALLHLDQRVVAGIPLRAQIEEAYRLPASIELADQGVRRGYSVVARETLVPADAPAASGAQAELVSGVPADASSKEFVCIYSEQFAATDNLPSDAKECTLDGGAAEDPESGGAGAGAGAGPVSTSKYTEAVALPKLSPHDTPRLPIPLADEATNAAAKELLKLISTFQLRLKEKSPLKAKQKLRFVCGLKQCINAVKGGKVRILLLAPNTEANEAVDDKVDLLIGEAQAREVPVLYCLSKRILGKAVQLSMKQSAIAVLDPDGAYEHFKIIMKFLNPNPY